MCSLKGKSILQVEDKTWWYIPLIEEKDRRGSHLRLIESTKMIWVGGKYTICNDAYFGLRCFKNLRRTTLTYNKKLLLLHQAIKHWHIYPLRKEMIIYIDHHPLQCSQKAILTIISSTPKVDVIPIDRWTNWISEFYKGSCTMRIQLPIFVHIW